MTTEAIVDVEIQPRNRHHQRITEAVTGSAKAVTSVFSDFRAFLNRGNVFDLAIGLVMGVAFTAIVTSIVADLLTPFIGLALGGRDLNNLFIVLKCPSIAGSAPPVDIPNCRNFTTTVLAQSAGVLTWNYGNAIQACINFVIISILIFFLVKVYAAAFRREKPVVKTKKCEYCCTDIAIKATRCPNCTSLVQELIKQE